MGARNFVALGVAEQADYTWFLVCNNERLAVVAVTSSAHQGAATYRMGCLTDANNVYASVYLSPALRLGLDREQ